MKILFIGTVEFSYRALKKLVELNADIVGVCTKDKSNFNSDFDTTQFPKGVRTFAQSPNTDGRDIQFDYPTGYPGKGENPQRFRPMWRCNSS